MRGLPGRLKSRITEFSKRRFTFGCFSKLASLIQSRAMPRLKEFKWISDEQLDRFIALRARFARLRLETERGISR
jgi:hypothetical protein